MSKAVQKEAIINKQQSLTLLKNMIRISISSICFMRSIFPEDCFESKMYGKTEIRQLKSADYDSEGQVRVRNNDAFLLTQWLERGVFDALSQEFLSSMIFSIMMKHPTEGYEIVLENYEFGITFREDHTATVNGVPLISKDDLKNQSTKFVRMLIEFANTLDELPVERWITISLKYSDKAPSDYEPEFFEAGDEKAFSFKSAPIRVQVASLKTPHQEMNLKFIGLESLLLEDILGHDLSGKAKSSEPERPSSCFRGSSFSSVTTPAIEAMRGLKMDDVDDQVDCTKSKKGDEVTGAHLQSGTASGLSRDMIPATATPDVEAESLCAIRDYVIRSGKFTLKSCVNELKLPESRVREALKHMSDDGLICLKGRNYTTSLQPERPCFTRLPPTLSSAMDCELKTPSRSKATGAVSDSRGCEGVDDIEASCADDESHLQIPEVHRTLENSKLRTNQLVIVHENKRDDLGGSQTKRERDDGQEVSLSQTSDRSDSSRNVRRKFSTIKDPIHLKRLKK